MYNLDEEDLKKYLQWGFDSPLWDEGRNPTEEEMNEHWQLGEVGSILFRAAYHAFVPSDPGPHLWNFYLDTGSRYALKYYLLFRPEKQFQLSFPESSLEATKVG